MNIAPGRSATKIVTCVLRQITMKIAYGADGSISRKTAQIATTCTNQLSATNAWTQMAATIAHTYKTAKTAQTANIAMTV